MSKAGINTTQHIAGARWQLRMPSPFYATICALAMTFAVSTTAWAQGKKYTISGSITDGASGEDLMFANIIVGSLEGVGTTTNEYGFYSLELPEGTYTVEYRYLGYQSRFMQVDLHENKKINIELESIVEEMEEVVISAESEDQNVTEAKVGVTQIDISQVKELPAFGGEPDVMRVIQTTPGVKTAGEGNAGYYVRGGGLDQNLVLLDEAPVYNPSHLLGFFSVFNSDALKGATMYKGASLPEYGGRTSSVLDVRMKEGNNKKLAVSGGIGTIASRLTVEAPIVKDKGSFIISGRRTYADLFLGLSDQFEGSSLYFYDLNLKANYKIGENDRIFLSGYLGRDRFGFDNAFGLNWGNTAATLRWNHFYSGRLFSNTALIYSNYDYEMGFGKGDDAIALESVIKDINFKHDFSYTLNDRNFLKFGANVIHHTIEPGNLSAGKNTGVNSRDAEKKYGLESAIYLQNESKITNAFSLNYGLRYSFFHQLGPATKYSYDSKGRLVDANTVNDGDVAQFYGGLEPRLIAAYVLNKKSSIKGGYNRNYQYMHMLTNNTSSTPTDTWVMSSNNIQPQVADQVSLGYFRNFKENTYEASVEGYYKEMQNVIDYRNGANVFVNDQLEGDLVYGKGLAYGLEFMVKKKTGKLTGWVSYTLSRSLRQMPEVNEGNWYSAKQDRIHDISIVASYKLNEKFTLASNYVFYTGDAVTFPAGRYEVDGKIVPYYTERNGYRMPNYNRLDLSLTKKIKKSKKFESSWNISLYNTFGTENAYSITFQPNENDPSKTEAVRLALFRWVPSFTYNFKF